MRALWECVLLSPFSNIMICADGSVAFNAVDIFNANTGTWSTAALSEPLWFLAATSLPNLGLAIFAGGWSMLFDIELSFFFCFVCWVFVRGGGCGSSIMF